MLIKRIGPLSLGKTLGAIYGIFGLFFGAIFSLLSVLGMVASAAAAEGAEGAIVGLLFGVGAIVILPLFYGAMGFLAGLVTAAIYNVVSRWTGGIEIETAPIS